MNATSHQHPDQERIEEEASVWAARLRGGITDEQRKELDGWLAADPEHGWILSRYRQLSAELDDGLAPVIESAAVTLAARRRRRWQIASGVFAAAAAVAIVFVVLAGRGRELTTRLAERHVATLHDGSRVELNARTSLAVEFSGGERRVRLNEGEAYFSVAKDPARPFVVETPSGRVRVTGTVFNVRAAEKTGTEVTVLEGSVRVRLAEAQAEAPAPLGVGDRVVMRGTDMTRATVSAGTLDDVIAWRQGHAVFHDTPLVEVMERFGSYHAVEISVQGAAAELRLGGRYSLNDLAGLLEAVERILPVRVTRTASAVRIEASPR